MKNTLLAALPLLPLAFSVDSPQFVREADDAISSTWTVTKTSEAIEATLSLMGNDQDIGSGATTTTRGTSEFVDTYKKVTDEGAPLVVSRSFEGIEREVGREGVEDSEGMRFSADEGESELTGQEVVFTYDAESEDWSGEYGEESDGESDWLEELAPRVDLASVLPPDGTAPEEGDQWSLEPGFLTNILKPGGTVFVVAGGDDGGGEEGEISITVPTSSDYDRWDELEGDVEATFAEVIEKDDLKLAKIVVTVEVAGDIDIIDELEDGADERGTEESYNDATMSRSLDGEIIILWNLAENRPESLEASLTGTSAMQAEWTLAAGGNELEIAVSMEDEVSYEISATFGD